LIGDGTKRAQLERLARHAGNALVTGPVSDRLELARLLASADALVHGCEAETFCMAAAEARASGIPLIVPDRGGAADHAGGGAGVRYAAGNAQAAARAIVDLFAGQVALSAEPVPVVTTADHFARLFAEYERIAGAARQAA